MIRRFQAFFVAIVVWHVLSVLMATPIFPSPLECAKAAVELFGPDCKPNCIVDSAGASLKRVGIGFLLAAFLGVMLGALAGVSKGVGAAFRDVLEFLRPIPPIAWVPLAIVAFQSSEQSAWFIVFVGAFFPISIQVCHAFANCPANYLEVARAYNASSWVTFWWVRVPAAGPEIAQGLRVGLGLAWTSVIAAELVGVKSGLGNQLLNHSIDLYFADLIVCMMAIGFLGWVMTFFANTLERRLITWRQASE